MPWSWGLSNKLCSSFLDGSIFSRSAASTMYLKNQNEIYEVKEQIPFSSQRSIEASLEVWLRKQHLHYRIDASAVSLPHAPEARLSSNVPNLHKQNLKSFYWIQNSNPLYRSIIKGEKCRGSENSTISGKKSFISRCNSHLLDWCLSLTKYTPKTEEINKIHNPLKYTSQVYINVLLICYRFYNSSFTRTSAVETLHLNRSDKLEKHVARQKKGGRGDLVNHQYSDIFRLLRLMESPASALCDSQR